MKNIIVFLTFVLIFFTQLLSFNTVCYDLFPMDSIKNSRLIIFVDGVIVVILFQLK